MSVARGQMEIQFVQREWYGLDLPEQRVQRSRQHTCREVLSKVDGLERLAELIGDEDVLMVQVLTSGAAL